MNRPTGINRRAGCLAGLLLPILLLAGCAQKSGLPTGTIEISREGRKLGTFEVELAETGADQQKGLMNRKSMPRDHGMAFLFDSPVLLSFYMKDTLIPLDIAFWDEDGKIVDIQTMAPCSAEPCELYAPATEFVGALEVNAGVFESLGMAADDRLSLKRD